MRNLCSTGSITGTSLSVYSRSSLNNHQLIQFAFHVRSLLRRTFRRYVNPSIITVSRGEQEDPTLKPFLGFKLAIFGYLGDKWFLKPNVLAVIYIRKLDHGTRCKWQNAFNCVLCLEKKDHWPFFIIFPFSEFFCLTSWLHSHSLFNWYSWAFPNQSQVKWTSFFKKNFHRKRSWMWKFYE